MVCFCFLNQEKQQFLKKNDRNVELYVAIFNMMISSSVATVAVYFQNLYIKQNKVKQSTN